jgi:FkbH-like protein
MEWQHVQVKCVVWDLDDTVWSGTLAEGDRPVLRPGAYEAMEELDSRGILQSVASRNDPQLGWDTLVRLGIDIWLLYPQINWGAKHESIRRIAGDLNIGLDTLLFVDNDPYERAEVQSVLPQVRVADAELSAVIARPDLTPATVTAEARRRRLMYLEEQRRGQAQENFAGPTEEFLASLQSRYVIRRAAEGDLARAGELVLRTNQLNATGYMYTIEELVGFCTSDRYELLVMELADRFGDLGIVGLALVERDASVWTIKLLLSSCRVMSRGAGGVLLHQLIALARSHDVTLRAHYVRTGRNRLMLASYRIAGFVPIDEQKDWTLLELGDASPASAQQANVIMQW